MKLKPRAFYVVGAALAIVGCGGSDESNEFVGLLLEPGQVARFAFMNVRTTNANTSPITILNDGGAQGTLTATGDLECVITQTPAPGGIRERRVGLYIFDEDNAITPGETYNLDDGGLGVGYTQSEGSSAENEDSWAAADGTVEIVSIEGNTVHVRLRNLQMAPDPLYDTETGELVSDEGQPRGTFVLEGVFIVQVTRS